MSLSIEVLKSDSGRCRLELTGRLDSSTAAHLDEKVETVDCSEHPVHIVDLSALEIVNPQPQVKKVFDIINALPNESLFTSEEELDAYLDRVQRANS